MRDANGRRHAAWRVTSILWRTVKVIFLEIASPSPSSVPFSKLSINLATLSISLYRNDLNLPIRNSLDMLYSVETLSLETPTYSLPCFSLETISNKPLKNHLYDLSRNSLQQMLHYLITIPCNHNHTVEKRLPEWSLAGIHALHLPRCQFY